MMTTSSTKASFQVALGSDVAPNSVTGTEANSGEPKPAACTILSERLMRIREVLQIVGVARPTLYQWMARDAFPRPLKLGGAAVAWREREIRDWLGSRPRALGGAPGVAGLRAGQT